MEVIIMVLILAFATLCGYLFAGRKKGKEKPEEPPQTEVYRFSEGDGFKIIRTKTAIIVDYTQGKNSARVNTAKDINLKISCDGSCEPSSSDGNEDD